MTVSPQSDPELSWRYAAAASTSCPLFIWDDLVMLGVHPQGQQPARLIALSLADGQIAWQKPLAYHYVHHLAAAFRDTTPILYTTLNSSDFLRDQATLKAWDKTGQELWQWQAPTVAQLFSRISLYKEQLWFTADSANLWYMNTTNDQEIRRYPLNINASWAAPLVISGMVIVPCKGPRLLALDKNGTGRWLYNASASTAHWLDRTPVRIGDDLIASFSRSLVVCLETNTGLERWQTAVGPVGKEISRPATDGQRVFVGTRAGLYALDVRTGQIVWHYATERGIIARPQVESGHVYLASHDHRIHIVAAATGKLLWQSDDLLARLEESLALDKRFILAINRRGELSALRPPSPLTNSYAEGYGTRPSTNSPPKVKPGALPKCGKYMTSPYPPPTPGKNWANGNGPPSCMKSPGRGNTRPRSGTCLRKPNPTPKPSSTWPKVPLAICWVTKKWLCTGKKPPLLWNKPARKSAQPIAGDRLPATVTCPSSK